MNCDFLTTDEGNGWYRHECRACARTVKTPTVLAIRQCTAGTEVYDPQAMVEPPESDRRRGICNGCTDRPEGCWKARDYDCQKKLKAAERHAVNFGRCPLQKWEQPKPLPPGECPACLADDPIPEPEESHPQSWRNRHDVRDRHIAALNEMARRDFFPPDNLAGDGVVTCGEGKYWPGLVVAVRMLRETGCTLPVQIWHNGPVGEELSSDPLTRLIDAGEFRKRHQARVLRGWEIKTYAIMHSGFRRVLFIDADCYAVADPAPRFALLEETPFVYWEDLHCCIANVHYDWFGLSRESVFSIPPIQGGQLFIDVAAFWREMMLTHWLCQHSDYTFGHGFGDQDMYRVALAVTGKAYRRIGTANWRRVAFVCEHGGPLFVHRCRSKLIGKEPRSHRLLPMEARVLAIYRSLVPPPPPVPHHIKVARLRAVRRAILQRR